MTILSIMPRREELGAEASTSIVGAPAAVEPQPLSPARADLAQRLEGIRVAEETAASARRVADRARAMLEEAEAAVRRAEGQMAAFSGQEAADIEAWAKAGGDQPQPKPRDKQRTAVQRDIDAAQRRTVPVRAAAIKCEAELEAAQRAVREAHQHPSSALLALISAEQEAVVGRLRRARQELVAAERLAGGYLAALFDTGHHLKEGGHPEPTYRGWMAEGERAGRAINGVPPAAVMGDERQAWRAWLDHLLNDPKAGSPQSTEAEHGKS